MDKFRCRLGLSAVNLIEETAVPTCSATGFLTKRVAGLPTCVAIADADLSANVSLLGQTISFITPAEIVDECIGSQSFRRNAGDTAWECYTPSVGGVVTTSYPMPLSTISVSNANAFVDTIDGTNFDYSGVRFVDAVTGDSFWSFKIPPNLAATPAWNLIITHKAVSGAGGNVSLFVECLDFATNVAFDAALTDLWGTAANPDEKAVSTSANTTITTISGTNFDGTEAIVASNYLVCRIARIGADANDTLGVDWLLLDVSVRIDENS